MLVLLPKGGTYCRKRPVGIDPSEMARRNKTSMWYQKHYAITNKSGIYVAPKDIRGGSILKSKNRSCYSFSLELAILVVESYYSS